MVGICLVLKYEYKDTFFSTDPLPACSEGLIYSSSLLSHLGFHFCLKDVPFHLTWEGFGAAFYLSRFSSGQPPMHFSAPFPRAQGKLCPWHTENGSAVWPGFVNLVGSLLSHAHTLRALCSLLGLLAFLASTSVMFLRLPYTNTNSCSFSAPQL